MKKIKTADIQARMVSHNAVISDIRVGDDMIWIPDDKAILTVVIAGQQAAGGKVSGFARKWRARKDSNL